MASYQQETYAREERISRPSNGDGRIARTNGDGQTTREPSIAHHLRQLSEEGVELVRKEVELAKAETSEKLSQAKRGVAEAAVGGAVLAGGMLTLLAAAVLLIGLVLPYWASALIVGGGTAMVGFALLGKAKHDTNPSNLTPDRTVNEVKRTQRMAKEHV